MSTIETVSPAPTALHIPLTRNASIDGMDAYRALVAEAGVLATTVIGVAERHGRRWVHLDCGAFNGMMESLDPHSSYLDVAGYADLRDQTRGAYGGLGL